MKPGAKTTEFYVVCAVIVLAVLSTVLNEIPAPWAATIAAVLGALYAISRTLLKLRGMGAQADLAESLRDIVGKEISFALKDKRRAEEIEK